MTFRQTSPIPPIDQVEQSWSLELRSLAAELAPGQGIRNGLELGLPASGLTPALSQGILMVGDRLHGISGNFLPSVPASQTGKKLFFDLNGLHLGDANNAPLSTPAVLVGEITSNADSIVSVAQQMNYGALRFGVRGQIDLALCTKGADVDLFAWAVPSVGLGNVRVTYAQTRVLTAATGNDAGDDFVLKVKPAGAAATLVTVDDAALTAGAIGRFAAADADAVSWWGEPTLTVQYNQTDPGANLTGKIEVTVLFEMF